MNTHSDNIADLAKALAAAQASLSAAKKDAVNPHFKNHYATLQSVWDAAKEVLSPNGLSVVQTFEATDGQRMDITTTMLHTSGQWIRGTLSMIPQRADPQGIGSAITYGRRYALAAILGIVADEDDDGNGASQPPQTGSYKGPAPAPTASRAVAPRPAAQASAVGQVDWRSVIVPKFIKKYAGATLGDMEPKDLIWWADNYEPKPFRGSISEADLAFKRSLDAARAEMSAPKPEYEEAAASAAAKRGENATPAEDDDIPY